MIHVPLFAVAAVLYAFALLVWKASPDRSVNRTFTVFTLVVAVWVTGVAGAHTGAHMSWWIGLSWAAGALIPVSSLAFISSYSSDQLPASRRFVAAAAAPGVVLGLLSVTTDLVTHSPTMVGINISRRAGPLFPLVAAYMLATSGVALYLFVRNWRLASGRTRAELNYLAAGILIPGALAILTNVIYPLATDHSTYTWIGPYFALSFIAVVGHAIVRRRVSSLRLVLHRGLTVVIAAVLSSIPVGILLWLVWPRLFGHLDGSELLLVVLGVCAVSLALPIAGNLGTRIVDRYVYRTRADYQSTVREASRVLTRVLDLDALLHFIGQTVARCTEAEGVAIYLKTEAGFVRAIPATRRGGSDFDAPETAAADVVSRLERDREPLVTEGVLALPIIADSGVIAFIAVGRKLAGDPFYPHDLDLLMTLANQAGIAIKNAQLYAEVVIANEHVENIVATIESGVVAVASSGRVSMFNRAAERLTGQTADVVKGQPAGTLPASLSEALLACLHDGQARTNPEIELAGAAVMCTTSPLRGPDGSVLGAVAVFSDLTRLKELETERRQAERLAYFEVLAAGIAHEIKNPLVAIKTFAQLVPRRHHDPAFVQEFARVVNREIGRMERLLERLGALARPGRRSHVPLDVRRPVAETIESISPTFEDKGIALTADLGDAACFVLGHHPELEQLFLNLLLNAHEATPPGGAVRVELVREHRQVTVSVADSGLGIPPELIERVFDPFFTTKQRGSGLGLAICGGIAQTHGARLRADNRPEGGAVFLIDFPLVSQPIRVDA